MVTVLKQKGVPANKVPTVGQDASLGGIENVLQGYQCGTVYKAIYLEAQDAVALATILRAGLTPPTALVNSTTSPPTGKPGNTQVQAAGAQVTAGSGDRRRHQGRQRRGDRHRLICSHRYEIRQKRAGQRVQHRG